jgi:hypothetical protein
MKKIWGIFAGLSISLSILILMMIGEFIEAVQILGA